MKKIVALLIAALLILSLAACGNSDKDGSSEKDKGKSTAEATQKAEETEAPAEEVTEAPEPTEEDPNMVVIQQEELIGSWTFPGMEGYEELTFNEDGTGSYKGINDKDLTFTYTVSPETRQFANGEDYINNMLKIEYSTGEAEDIVIFYNEEHHLCFHNSENGGYSGVISYAEWVKL